MARQWMAPAEQPDITASSKLRNVHYFATRRAAAIMHLHRQPPPKEVNDLLPFGLVLHFEPIMQRRCWQVIASIVPAAVDMALVRSIKRDVAANIAYMNRHISSSFRDIAERPPESTINCSTETAASCPIVAAIDP